MTPEKVRGYILPLEDKDKEGFVNPDVVLFNTRMNALMENGFVTMFHIAVERGSSQR